MPDSAPDSPRPEPARLSGKIVVLLFVTVLACFGAFIMWKRSNVRNKLAADADAAAKLNPAGGVTDGGKPSDAGPPR